MRMKSLLASKMMANQIAITTVLLIASANIATIGAQNCRIVLPQMARIIQNRIPSCASLPDIGDCRICFRDDYELDCKPKMCPSDQTNFCRVTGQSPLQITYNDGTSEIIKVGTRCSCNVSVPDFGFRFPFGK